MRIFAGDSADEAWTGAAEAFRAGEDMVAQASRAGHTRELLHALIVVRDPRERWILTRQPAINPAFAIAEVVWLVAGRNDAAFLNHWNPALPRFAGNEPIYYGAYGHRLRENFGVDQLEHAFQTLDQNPDSRQVVLQIWDASRDLPAPDGVPRSRDVPCNVCSMLKVRSGRLEWTQVLRSNDLFLGVPHNIIQFTTLQEVIAGWLGLELGSYTHFSDSLHVYERDIDHLRDTTTQIVLRNSDSLLLSKSDADVAWSEIEQRMGAMVSTVNLSLRAWESLVTTANLPEGVANLFRVVAADDARRRGWADVADDVMISCSNPVLSMAWQRWAARCEFPKLCR